MQLVGDCVIMYDTMKDKRIGLAEVIEKFGVPPEKVIEVQALIGDSTDNVPGVPGIGVKTAAQLIDEYGDLETLLARAGEIKQDKRRQTLIDNAEQARISKRLVTLDQHVDARRAGRGACGARAGLQAPGRVPQGDGVHHADAARRREVRASRRATIEPDAKLTSREIAITSPAAALAVTSPAGEGGEPTCSAGTRLPNPPPQAGEGAHAPAARASNGASRPPRSPPRIWRRRATSKIDRSKYETVRTLDRLNAWVARASDVGVVALDTETTSLDPMHGAAVRLLARGRRQRGLLRADRPPRRRHGGRRRSVRAGAEALRRTRSRSKHALERAQGAAGRPGVLKIGQNLKYDWQIFARRGIDVRPTTTPC